MNTYYQITKKVIENSETTFHITLLPDFQAYKGHFPGNPVSPGVCNIQMIKECTEQLAGKHLLLKYIKKCKFSAVITPQTTPHLQLRIQLTEADEMYKVEATVFDDSNTYIDFKGDFSTNR